MKGEKNHINERYVHVARFFEYTRQHNPDMYDVVCDISWGAMVAGLLSGKDQFKRPRGGGKVEYFLDTPIVLGVLDLSQGSLMLCKQGIFLGSSNQIIALPKYTP